GVVVVIGLLFGFAFRWGTSELKDRNDPLNKSAAFVYSDNGTLHWFELTSRKGKVEGKFHQHKITGEIRKEMLIEREEYPLTGKKTEKGYEFKVNNSGEIMAYDARFSGPFLSVQKKGEKESKLYNPVNQKELDGYIESLRSYHAEEIEKRRLEKFFNDLHSVYGYLYSEENGSFQLFVKIDEALFGGELSGSLLMMADTGDKNIPYKETRYGLNGVTDGQMVRLYTTVDGKETKLEGDFLDGAAGFNASFWMTDQKLTFRSVTEEEYKQNYEEFKAKAQKIDNAK
ncbi:MAG TPA: hypothetical protein VEV44_09395, partial [Pseudoneobacillus sp.]|nr:hypothetical protein [Pseudoneobacillus sp.]